jgi:hypothetical protein
MAAVRIAAPSSSPASAAIVAGREPGTRPHPAADDVEAFTSPTVLGDLTRWIRFPKPIGASVRELI